VIGNMIGGLFLVTLLRLVRSKDRLLMERDDVHGEQSHNR
jgi:formate-nitrite transporter family protein